MILSISPTKDAFWGSMVSGSLPAFNRSVVASVWFAGAAKAMEAGLPAMNAPATTAPVPARRQRVRRENPSSRVCISDLSATTCNPPSKVSDPAERVSTRMSNGTPRGSVPLPNTVSVRGPNHEVRERCAPSGTVHGSPDMTPIVGVVPANVNSRHTRSDHAG